MDNVNKNKMVPTGNKFMIAVIVFLVTSVILSLLAIFNGSTIYRDGWFIPVMVAEIWGASLALRRDSL